MVLFEPVLQHVPPDELDEYFASLTQLIPAGATGLLFFTQWARKPKNVTQELDA